MASRSSQENPSTASEKMALQSNIASTTDCAGLTSPDTARTRPVTLPEPQSALPTARFLFPDPQRSSFEFRHRACPGIGSFQYKRKSRDDPSKKSIVTISYRIVVPRGMRLQNMDTITGYWKIEELVVPASHERSLQKPAGKRGGLYFRKGLKTVKKGPKTGLGPSLGSSVPIWAGKAANQQSGSSHTDGNPGKLVHKSLGTRDRKRLPSTSEQKNSFKNRHLMAADKDIYSVKKRRLESSAITLIPVSRTSIIKQEEDHRFEPVYDDCRDSGSPDLQDSVSKQPAEVREFLNGATSSARFPRPSTQGLMSTDDEGFAPAYELAKEEPPCDLGDSESPVTQRLETERAEEHEALTRNTTLVNLTDISDLSSAAGKEPTTEAHGFGHSTGNITLDDDIRAIVSSSPLESRDQIQAVIVLTDKQLLENVAVFSGHPAKVVPESTKQTEEGADPNENVSVEDTTESSGSPSVIEEPAKEAENVSVSAENLDPVSSKPMWSCPIPHNSTEQPADSESVTHNSALESILGPSKSLSPGNHLSTTEAIVEANETALGKVTDTVVSPEKSLNGLGTERTHGELAGSKFESSSSLATDDSKELTVGVEEKASDKTADTETPATEGLNIERRSALQYDFFGAMVVFNAAVLLLFTLKMYFFF